MIIDVKYNKVTTFTGRNGTFKQSGLSVTKHGDVVTLEPITSKGALGHCQINIPNEDIKNVLDALITALHQIQDTNENYRIQG